MEELIQGAGALGCEHPCTVGHVAVRLGRQNECRQEGEDHHESLAPPLPSLDPPPLSKPEAESEDVEDDEELL